MSKKLPQHVHRTSDVLSIHIRRRFSPYKPREKGPNEALAPAINFWDLPVYQPQQQAPARPGASDHLHIKSRGV